MIAAKARDFYEAEAKKRMSAGGKDAGRARPRASSENSEQGWATLPTPIRARDQAGKAVGISGRTVDKAK